MSGRDLLYKPPVPLKTRDDDEKAGRVGTRAPKGREIGSVGEPYETKALPTAAEGDAAAEQGRPPARRRAGPPAYRNPYFNKDVEAVRQPNQRTSGMQALRGDAAVTDLKKVVLPSSPLGVDQPVPALLRDATELMGLAEAFRHNLQSLINRQGKWARGEGVTAEMLRERLARLKQMIEDRRTAIARLAALSSSRIAQSATVAQAVQADGAALDQTADVAAEGSELIERTSARARPMHGRLAKVLGHKPAAPDRKPDSNEGAADPRPPE